MRLHALRPTSRALVSAVLVTELPQSFTSTDKAGGVSREYHYPFLGGPREPRNRNTGRSCSDCGPNSLQLMNTDALWHPIDSCTTSVKLIGQDHIPLFR